MFLQALSFPLAQEQLRSARSDNSSTLASPTLVKIRMRHTLPSLATAQGVEPCVPIGYDTLA